MNEAVIVYSKVAKQPINFYSFDVIEYNKNYFAGFELQKNFNNFLAGDPNLSVKQFNNIFDAKNYFNKIAF